MLLKKLDIYGFKSFADRISMKFDKGITAIVGPNGCGKSNVADAVRWVLGEQSAKSLRGSKMEDVIFSGTQLRKSLGFAEDRRYNFEEAAGIVKYKARRDEAEKKHEKTKQKLMRAEDILSELEQHLSPL